MLPIVPDGRDPVIVLITDGLPSHNQNPCSLQNQIQNNTNLKFGVVGIGQQLIENLQEVSCLASPSDLVFTTSFFNTLTELLIDVTNVICEADSPFDGM
jgi:hypothetical protein